MAEAWRAGEVHKEPNADMWTAEIDIVPINKDGSLSTEWHFAAICTYHDTEELAKHRRAIILDAYRVKGGRVIDG